MGSFIFQCVCADQNKELEEPATSFNNGLSSQHTPLAIVESVKILMQIPAKDKVNHEQTWLIFILCVVLCLLRLKQARFLGSRVSLQINSPLSSI